MSIESDSLFGIAMSTYREKDLSADSIAFFQHESIIAAVAILFCRLTISSHDKELFLLRLFFSLCLGLLAFWRKPYVIICALQAFSYMVPWTMTISFTKLRAQLGVPDKLIRLVFIGLSAILSLVLSHLVLSEHLFPVLSKITPVYVQEALFFLVPIEEATMAYDVITKFINPIVLNKQLAHLLFVTFNIQVGLGYLGIDFLKKEQQRRNQLVRMDMDTSDTNETTGKAAEENMAKKSEASRRFQRSAAPFILATAIPYMLQIIFYGNMNFFAFHCLKHDLHRAVRLNELFDHESRLTAVSNNSATSPDMYASAMDTIVTTVYDFCNRKMFSLPKLLLLPSIIMRQPLMVAQITPFIFASDFLKGKVMTYLTTNIERLEKESLEVSAIRTKVEAFDMKNAELLQRSGSGATKFTQKRWEELTVSIQAKTFMASFLGRTKSFFNWIQHHFVFSVMIDCALAQLLSIGKIVSAEIFVFSRAIEDAVDTVLMRSRAEAELARMLTKITKLQELADVWERSSLQNPLPCTIAPTSEHAPGIVLRNLQYSRGTASVRVDHFDIKPGVYALTGANGSGKSTLFRLLMSCSSNEKRVDLPPSIVMSSVAGPLVEESDMTDKQCSGIDEVCPPESETIPADSANHHIPKLDIILPSNNVVEISQTFYWPLYTKPIDWIYQHHHVSDKMLSEKTQKVAELLQELDFMQANPEDEVKGKELNISDIAPPGGAVSEIINQLNQVKEDWFNDLSGGQKSKVELVRKVNTEMS